MPSVKFHVSCPPSLMRTVGHHSHTFMNTKINSDKEANDLRQLIAANDKESAECQQTIDCNIAQNAKMKKRVDDIVARNEAAKPKDEEAAPKSFPRGAPTHQAIHELNEKRKKTAKRKMPKIISSRIQCLLKSVLIQK